MIDIRTLKPLDSETIINSVKKTNHLVTVEEGWSFCGVASEISAIICEKAFDYLDAEPRRVTAKDVPLPYANKLEKLALPSIEDICNVVKEVCYKA